MPAWAVVAALLAVALPALAFCGFRVVNRVFPTTTEDRLTWWKAFWGQRADAKAARRRWRTQVRRERRAHRAGKRSPQGTRQP